MPALLLPPPSLCPKCLHSPKVTHSLIVSRDESTPAPSPLFNSESQSHPMNSFNDRRSGSGVAQPKGSVQTPTESPNTLPSLLGPISSFLYQHACQAHHEDSPQISPAATPDTKKDSERRERYAQRCPPRLTELNPPSNFGTVLDGRVFRSAFPKAENFAFLKSLGIKTILTLVPGPYYDDYVNFMDEHGIQHVQVHIPPNKGEVCVNTADIIKALEVVMNPENFPLLIHCNKGKHRTGCVVGTLRKCQGWSIEDIIGEYHVYATAKARLWDEVFLKFFNERRAVSTVIKECLDGIMPKAILEEARFLEMGTRDGMHLTKVFP